MRFGFHVGVVEPTLLFIKVNPAAGEIRLLFDFVDRIRRDWSI
jgi:hypothetical protein